MVPI
jgi:hypothetical protein